MSANAIIALKRFGLGQRTDEVRLISQDPQSWLLDQLERPEGLQITPAPVSSAQAWQRFRVFAVARRKARKRGDMATANSLVRPQFYRQDIQAHIAHAVATQTPFLERLCWFWSNHFCISAAKNPSVRAMAGGYEREAIRPFVLGNFRDMLQAVVRHPAMLIYLDNIKSYGPNSKAGIRRNKGLNENLAREILELHTLGVNGGYNQQDIINFAKALTGWNIGWLKSRTPGEFLFNPRAHEPGTVTVLGKTYRQEGQRQAAAILDDLARHPATARFIARKLAVHFVGEKAPQALTDQLAKVFQQTDGNLKAVATALVKNPLAWREPRAKFLPPLDTLVTVARALDITPPEKLVRRTLRIFGQPMWSPPSPAGWPDGDNSWASGDALLERLDWAYAISARIPKTIRSDIIGFADDLFADSLSRDTTLAIARAPTRKDAFSLLLLSPEMQRR